MNDDTLIYIDSSGSVKNMKKTWTKGVSKKPYLHLLAAVVHQCDVDIKNGHRVLQEEKDICDGYRELIKYLAAGEQ